MPRPFGIEEELLVVAGQDASAVPAGPAVVRQAGRDGTEVDQEFKQQQVEIGSAPNETAAAMLVDLRARRAGAIEAAQRVGARIAALATHPLPVHASPTENERYGRMATAFGVTAREQLTCGQHVHVEIGDRHEGVDVLNRIAPWLAVLTAVAANSPYWQGEDTGFASFRSVRWGLWPTAVPLQGLSGPLEYDSLITSLIESGAALDPGMLYFDARLSVKYPTVEIRVADVSTDVEDAVLVGVLCRALVETAIRDRAAGVPVPDVRPELLRAAAFRATRSGLTGDLVHVPSRRSGPAAEVVRALQEHVAEALLLTGDLELVEHGLGRVLRGGAGAERQRAVHRENGELSAVVEDAVERTRG